LLSASPAHPYQRLADVLSLQQADEGGRRILKAVRYVLTVTDAPVGDAGADGFEEFGIMIRGEFVIDERCVRLLVRTSRMVAGRRFGPLAAPAVLYWEISPQTGTRANVLSSGNTVCQTAPPTFSK
jgi:hypothetical protein